MRTPSMEFLRQQVLIGTVGLAIEVHSALAREAYSGIRHIIALAGIALGVAILFSVTVRMFRRMR